jgi:hypothetical protein
MSLEGQRARTLWRPRAAAVPITNTRAAFPNQRVIARRARDTTCCYARQDKFWVKGAPGGERWEIYTVLEDSPTFWGQDGRHSWAAAEAALDETPGTSTGGQAVQCCGGR